jgi:hypothetical protein
MKTSSWTEVITTEQEPEPEQVISDTKCCNCDTPIILTENWTPCSNCSFYNESLVHRYRNK